MGEEGDAKERWAGLENRNVYFLSNTITAAICTNFWYHLISSMCILTPRNRSAPVWTGTHRREEHAHCLQRNSHRQRPGKVY